MTYPSLAVSSENTPSAPLPTPPPAYSPSASLPPSSVPAGPVAATNVKVGNVIKIVPLGDRSCYEKAIRRETDCAYSAEFRSYVFQALSYVGMASMIAGLICIGVILGGGRSPALIASGVSLLLLGAMASRRGTAGCASNEKEKKEHQHYASLLGNFLNSEKGPIRQYFTDHSLQTALTKEIILLVGSIVKGEEDIRFKEATVKGEKMMLKANMSKVRLVPPAENLGPSVGGWLNVNGVDTWVRALPTEPEAL